MTVQQYYESVGGNYDDVLGRLMNEKRILKYLGKFRSTEEFEDMKAAVAAKDWENAFRHIHSLKGMALNLGLSKLAACSSELCETMRHGPPTVDISDLTVQVEETLAETKAAMSGILD